MIGAGSPTPRLRVAVVGLGFGAVHAAAFRQDPRAEVVALCGRDRARVSETCARLGVPSAVVDYRTLLEPGVADVIALAVPGPVQSELGRAALLAGKHVFFEKPLADCVTAAQDLHDLARDRKTAINFEFPESAAWQETKRTLQSGRLGALRHAALTWRVETFANKHRTSDSWKTRSRDGGGALNLFTSHVFFNLEWLFGPLRAVFARIERAPHDPRAADTLNLLHVTTSTGLAISAHVAIDAFLGTGHRLEVYGDGGTLVLENSEADYLRGFKLSVATRSDGALQSVSLPAAPTSGEDGRVAATAKIAHRFVDSILGVASDPFPSAVEGLRVAQLAEAAMRSHDEGRIVQV